MKQLWLAIILILLATPVFAGNVVTTGMFGTVGGACESGTTAVDHLTATTSAGGTGISTTAQRGNSFVYTPGVDWQPYSVTIVNTSGTATVECRIGPDTDMTTYDAVGTVGVNGLGTYEIVFTTHPTLSSGTTYYWACGASAATPFLDKATEAYADGARHDGTDWALSAQTGDIRFIIKECTP